MKKTKLLASLLLFSAMVLAAAWPAQTLAATTGVTGGTNGPLCNSGGYFTPSSVTVASGDKITFSVPGTDPYSGGIQINGFPQGSFVVPRGGSVTTQALTANVSYQGTWPNELSCIKGSGTVTVQTASSSSPPSSGGSASSGASSAPSGSNPAAKSSAASNTPTPAATTQPAPETVVADTITVAGKQVTSMQDLTVSPSQPMVLSGTTVPNGKVTLTIHSNPITATVQADAAGKWSYTVKGLLAGSHTIEASVTDPATNQTSPAAKLLAFTVSGTPAGAVSQTADAAHKSSSRPAAMVLGLAAAVVVAAAVVFGLKMKGRNKVGAAASLPAVVPSPDVQPAPPAEPAIAPTSAAAQGSAPVPNGNGLEQEHKEDTQ